jgi:hypothetical protein
MLLFCSQIIASNFLFQNKTNSAIDISFNIGEFSIKNEEEYHKINSVSKGKLEQVGEPELPLFSFHYAISDIKNVNIEYTVLEYEIIENINLYPHQGLDNNGLVVKNRDLYKSNSKYPLENIQYNKSSLRGYEMLSISFVPFEYNFDSKELKVFKQVDISINEIELNDTDVNNNTPRSLIFENMYKNMIINDDVLLDNSRSIQKPSILYICGGNVATSDYDSFFKPLVEWRRKQGYIVNVASLSETGTSTTSIKNYISNAYYNWENPPEFVCLVGDASGSIDINTYNASGGGGGWGGGASGEGDFPYTLLEGNDILPDMIIGRMSVSNTGELYTVVNKIIGYEKNYADDTDWMSSAALVGDPYDSGISTVITNEYINTIMDIHGGISNISTMYSGSGFDTFMRNQINGGVSYLNYRGFYGFSNFTQSDINALNNGFRLPFLTTLTCDTGSFAEDNSCITESLFRAGSVNSPKGAVAVIGTAQPYTHTAFNNMVTMGIYDGLFLHGAQTAGEALVYGQLALSEIYPQNPNDNVYLFSTWNNLMGDPSTHLWTSSPINLDVNHTSLFIKGSNNFQVLINDTLGNPISNATVSLYKVNNFGIEIQMISKTNDSGIADFILDNPNTGRILVTSRCHNCIPVETYFDVSNDLPLIELSDNSLVFNDNGGNNDGYLNPSEVVQLSFNLVNSSPESISNGEVFLSALSGNIWVINDSFIVESINGNSQIQVSGLSIQVSPYASDLENAELRISLVSDSMQWDYQLSIDIQSGKFLLESSIVNDNNNNGILDRGESALLGLEISNLGSINLQDVVGSINFSSLLLDLDISEISFSDLQIGQSTNVIEPITVTANNNITNGTIISIPIELTTSAGYFSSEIITFQIGEVSVNDPLGPDLYGYYIYDQNDDYELAPDYDWLEIDPGYGGLGEEVGGISDNGDNSDDTSIVDLPFDFTFYGVEYDKLSICSNGWISFGETDMASFRNYTLPGPGGPSPIVAVFWDDLMTTGNGDVYTYYNQLNDYFVVEWSDVRTFYGNSLESFQVILYNTGMQTLTGDDEIKLQYKEFNNNSVGDYPVGNYDGAVVHGQYSTIGIENHLANDGLQYTYNNVYPEAAMPLSDGTALFITTGNPYLYASPNLSLNEEEIYINLQANQELTVDIGLSNNGEEGSLLIYESNIAAFGSSIVEVDDFGYSWTKSSVDDDIEYDWINIDDDNTVLVLPDNDSGSIASFNFNFPFYGSNYSFCAVMANGWLSFGALSEVWNNQSIFEEDSPRPAIFAFWDDLNPENLDGDGQGQIKYHSNNERTVIWYDNVIHWISEDRVYDFQIILYPSGKIALNYRSMQGDTGSSTIGIIDSNGIYGLEAVYNQDGFMEDNISILFDTAQDWANILSNQTGQVGYNQSTMVELGINTENLGNGSYNSFLVVNSNESIEPSVIPINLIVSDTGLILGDLNQDGILDVLDVVRLIQIILDQYDPSSFELMLSDLNEDDIVNVQDIVLMINTILTF